MDWDNYDACVSTKLETVHTFLANEFLHFFNDNKEQAMEAIQVAVEYWRSLGLTAQTALVWAATKMGETAWQKVLALTGLAAGELLWALAAALYALGSSFLFGEWIVASAECLLG